MANNNQNKNPKPLSRINYNKVTESAGVKTGDMQANNSTAGETLNTNDLKNKAKAYENSAGTTAPNATSIGHG